jgi:ABC-2 type transport system ATP-binding protein
MIKHGESITIEIFQLNSEHLESIKKLPNATFVNYKNNRLEIKFQKGKNNIIFLLDYLRNNDISFAKVYSELPTLNDVFLELTGKKLRD